MKWLFVLLAMLVPGIAAAQPVCTAQAPNAVSCQGQALNLQLSDIVLGQQMAGPQRPNQSVQIPLSQILNLPGSTTYFPFSGGTIAGSVGVIGSTTLSGGTLNGSYSGAPTLSGAWTFNAGLTGTLTGHSSLDLALTGGTVTGGTTFSGAGTALSVTNNATIGNILSLTNTLNLGPGGTGSASFNQSGTGNVSFNFGGSSSIWNFKNSSGVSMLQIGGTGGTSGNVAIQTQLSLPGRTWSGSSISANATLFQNATWTGSPGGNLGAYLNLLQETENLDVGTGGDVEAINIQNTTSGTGWTGNRHAAQVIQNISSAPGSFVGNGNTYTALNVKVNGMVNVGGTGTTFGAAKGAVFGFNPVAHLGPLATNWSAVIGAEIDTWEETGASVLDRIGLQIVDITVGQTGVQGTRDDFALSFSNQYAPGAGVGFKVGLDFGAQHGYIGIATDGTLIYGENLGGAFTVANGIDWHFGTATNKWVQFGSVYSIDGSGNVSALSVQTAPVTVASLPTCNTAAKGIVRSVSDANSTTYNATAAGSGSNIMPVFCNGTNWTLH